MEAPVVEKPAAVSKNASVNELISPVIRYGSVPKNVIAIQDNPTMAKPSRAVSWVLSDRPNRHAQPPAATVIPAATTISSASAYSR